MSVSSRTASIFSELKREVYQRAATVYFLPVQVPSRSRLILPLCPVLLLLVREYSTDPLLVGEGTKPSVGHHGPCTPGARTWCATELVCVSGISEHLQMSVGRLAGRLVGRRLYTQGYTPGDGPTRLSRPTSAPWTSAVGRENLLRRASNAALFCSFLLIFCPKSLLSRGAWTDGNIFRLEAREGDLPAGFGAGRARRQPLPPSTSGRIRPGLSEADVGPLVLRRPPLPRRPDLPASEESTRR